MTLQSQRMVRTTLLVLVFGLVGFTRCPTETTSPTPTAVQLTGKGDSYVEITLAASPPVGDGPCKNGMILAGAGDGTERVLMGSLQAPLPSSYNVAQWDDIIWTQKGTMDTPPTRDTELPVGSDNQTATLANGDLVLMWNGGTKAPLRYTGANLSWWDDWGHGNVVNGQFVNHPWFKDDPKRKGFRGALILWRYSCAQGKWLNTTMMDAATAEPIDVNGKPQRGYNAAWAPYYGFDREELYVDPWGVDAGDNSKQRIFVSTRIENPIDRVWEVFMSSDTGGHWNPAGIRLGGEAPVVMTTTNNGRFFMFHPSDDAKHPILEWSDDHGTSLASPKDGYDISYVSGTPQAGSLIKFDLRKLTGAETGVGEAGPQTLSLARTGENAVLAVYPSTESVTVNNETFDRQIACVVWVVPKEKDPVTGAVEAPIVVPIKIIRAQAANGSVLMPSFIQDNRTNNNVETNMLYWLETASRPAGSRDPVKMVARYLLFNGFVPDTEKMLSDASGWELNNRKQRDATGDYMKGGFYADKGNMNFVAVWPQVSPSSPEKNKSQAYMRIITVADSTKPKLPMQRAETLPGHYTALPVLAPAKSPYKP